MTKNRDIAEILDKATTFNVSAQVGSNVVASNTEINVGNSTVNVAVNSTSMSVGSNVSVNTTSVKVGNSTVNTVANSTVLALPADGKVDFDSGVAYVGQTSTTGALAYVADPSNALGSTSHTWWIDGAQELALTQTALRPNADGGLALGSTANRYSSLFLSGSVFLGGITAANAIDDYEEGTWTPTYTTSGTDFSSVTYVAQQGTYVKIGSTVVVFINLVTSARTVGSASGNLIISGLPFTVGGTRVGYGGSGIGRSSGFATNAPTQLSAEDTLNYIKLYYLSSGASDTVCAYTELSTGVFNNFIRASIVYGAS